MTIKRRNQLGLSATTFLILCIWLGPDRACFFIGLAAFIAVWAALCKRFPALGWFTTAFFFGVVNGLLGGRDYRRW